MAAAQYLARIAGRVREVIAVITSTGPSDAGKIAALDDDGRFHTSLMPIGIAADVSMIEATETLAARDLVNIYNDAGTPKARKADASNARDVHGFVLELTNVGAVAAIYHEGSITGFSSLIAGARYYLSATTPGGVSTTPVPSATGQIHQYVGSAATAAKLIFEPDDLIDLVN